MTDFFSEPAPSFDSPIDMLVACHDRVRHFSSLTETLAEHVRLHGADAPARQAARNILRYFELAAPRHHADEEVDLFPLLRPHLSSERQQMLDGLVTEHTQLDSLWAKLRRELMLLAEAEVPSLSPLLCQAFARRYQQHAELEERWLYSEVDKSLSEEEIMLIGRAMQARRAG